MRGQVPVAELPDRAAEEVDRPGEPRCRGPPRPSLAPAQADRKLVSRLWEVARKLPAVAVVTSAGLVWTPEQFVRQHLGQVGLVMVTDECDDDDDNEDDIAQDPAKPGLALTPAEKKAEASAESARRSWLSGRVAGLPAEVRLLTSV